LKDNNSITYNIASRAIFMSMRGLGDIDQSRVKFMPMIGLEDIDQWIM